MVMVGGASVVDLRPATTLAAINVHAEERAAGAVQCRMARGKGRVLVAARAFEPGEVVLTEAPLHTVREAPGDAAFEALRELCSDWEDGEDEVQWYWYGLCSLTAEELAGGPLAAAPWERPTDEARARLLLLHEGGAGSSRPSRRTSEVARRLAPRLRDAGVLERCLQAFKLNSFDYSDDATGTNGAALYFLPSFMSHSCAPSAVWHVDAGDTYVLRARSSIAAGDEVTVTYLDEFALLDHAALRRADLFGSKDFWCSCQRCTASQDRCRGFRCPACQRGPVFARAPGCRDLPKGMQVAESDSGSEDDGDDDSDGRCPWLPRASAPRRGKTLRLLAGAACSACGRPLAMSEAERLAEAEAELQAILERWRAAGKVAAKQFRPAAADVSRAEELMEQYLPQHGCAQRARKFLARHYAAIGQHGKQLSALQARVDFARAAYPGISAACAWALEACADALAAQGLKAQEKDEAAARTAYGEALGILSLMFGEDHEYASVVREKLSALPAA